VQIQRRGAARKSQKNQHAKESSAVFSHG